MKHWKIIADNLSKAGWSWGCVSGVDSSGRTIWIADAHRDDGKRFVVRADEKLTAFLGLESATHDSYRVVLTKQARFSQTRHIGGFYGETKHGTKEDDPTRHDGLGRNGADLDGANDGAAR
jgi:hypothetical protein